MIKAKPFVKWAGGKRQVIDKLTYYAPKKFNKYYEPFVGGGALLFELSPKSALINDLNKELINAYLCIKDKTSYFKMCQELDRYEKTHTKEFYYQLRNVDRNKKKYKRIIAYKRAARTIYLNKACFNGLYRVNSNNEFNVPFNGKDKLSTYDEQNLSVIHAYLNDNEIIITSTDFEKAVSDAKKGDFVYFDPPYDSDTLTFNSYTKDGFDRDDQIRLAKVYKSLDSKGCYVMLSNHDTKLIRHLYDGFNFYVIDAKRSINSNGTKRGAVKEVIITNYEGAQDEQN